MALNRFKKEFKLALVLFREGLINRSQFANEASESARRLGRDTDEDLPVKLLQENGINTDAIQKLKQGAEDYSGLEVAEIARSIAGKGEKGEEKREEAEEKAEEAKEKGEEKAEEGQDKGEEAREDSESEGSNEAEEERGES